MLIICSELDLDKTTGHFIKSHDLQQIDIIYIFKLELMDGANKPHTKMIYKLSKCMS